MFHPFVAAMVAPAANPLGAVLSPSAWAFLQVLAVFCLSFGALVWLARPQTRVFLYQREYPIAPSQEAITGALMTYIKGGINDNVRQMLRGLSVLRYATKEQIAVAIPFVEASQNVTSTCILKMLARRIDRG